MNEKPSAPNPTPAPVLVPIDSLSEDVLAALIESFVLREGTDYGLTEASHETKIKQIAQQLKSGQVKIVFDPASESVNLVMESDWKRLHRS